MDLQVTHDTHYRYTPAVETAQHMAFLQPVNTATQQVLQHTLAIHPEPVHRAHTQDVFGNHRCFFSLQAPHEELLVSAHSHVLTRALPLHDSHISWEDMQESMRFHKGAQYDPAAEYLFPSPHVPRDEAFALYAQPSFAPGTPVLAGARDLMQRIYTDFAYEPHSTQVNTPALEALGARRGVCQDFAHIMLACLRALGLPARYVSGYLLTQAPEGEPRRVGSDASHAWVSVYLPDWPAQSPWCDLDPTNNRLGCGSPGEDYVTLAHGRDYSDVSPLRGVIHGGARHTLAVAVTVAPTLSDNGGPDTAIPAAPQFLEPSP
jgi:transglutaminase-like putative cysteine protease